MKGRIISEGRDLSPGSASRQENSSGGNDVEKNRHVIGVYVIVFLWICNKECKLPYRASVRSLSNIVYSRYEYRSIGKP